MNPAVACGDARRRHHQSMQIVRKLERLKGAIDEEIFSHGLGYEIEATKLRDSLIAAIDRHISELGLAQAVRLRQARLIAPPLPWSHPQNRPLVKLRYQTYKRQKSTQNVSFGEFYRTILTQ